MSPKLNFVHLCDTAFFSQEGKLNVIGIFKVIGTRQLPVVHPKLSVVLNLTLSKPAKLKLQILKRETGETIAKLEAKLEQKNENEHEKEINFISDFNSIKFEENGEYRVEIWIDDELIEVIPFFVQLAQPQKK